MGGGNAMGCSDMADEGIQLSGNAGESFGIAEAPTHVTEPLMALPHRGGRGAVGTVNGQTFA